MAASLTVLNMNGQGKSIDIYTNKIEHDYDKQLGIISKPVSSGSGGVHNDEDTFILDIGRLKEIITVSSGWLVDETGSSSYAKKANIDYILRRRGTVTITWKEDNAGSLTTVTKVANVVKCKIQQVPGRIGDSAQVLSGTQPKVYMINIQFAVGSHKG